MGGSVESINYSFGSPTKSKITALEESLQQSFSDFKVLVEEIERIHIINETLKSQLLSQREVSQSKDCCCEEMKKSLVAVLTRFNELKDWNILNEAFNILLGEAIVMTPPKENLEVEFQANIEGSDNGYPQSPQKLDSTAEDISFEEDSVLEIDGTPTGRTSPIIQPKKTRSTTVSGLGEKKKCSKNWPTPEQKTLRTPTRNTPNAKLRQSRLVFVKMKETSVVDLTLSPEFSGGKRCSQNESKSNTQICVKKEQINNDDTILPSPTSGPVEFTLHKNASKTGHQKLKSVSRKKRSTDSSENFLVDHMENSINLLANRLKKDTKPVTKEQAEKDILSPQKRPLAENKNCVNIDVKSETLRLDNNFKLPKEDIVKRFQNKLENVSSTDDVTTHYENEDSISLLKHAPISKALEPNFVEQPMDTEITYCETEATAVGDKLLNGLLNNKEAKPVPMYKEPAPRTKAEKLARPGWCCKECKDFWSEAYKDNPEMLKKKMDESSKHRGHHNPERPNTPEGYWYPRWNVPEDTEEFNRRNNAV